MSVVEECVEMSGNKLWGTIVEWIIIYSKDKAAVHEEHFPANSDECEWESYCMSDIYMRFNSE